MTFVQVKKNLFNTLFFIFHPCFSIVQQLYGHDTRSLPNPNSLTQNQKINRDSIQTNNEKDNLTLVVKA